MTVLRDLGRSLSGAYQGAIRTPWGRNRSQTAPPVTSYYGRPIAIVLGTHRVSGTIIMGGLYMNTLGGIWAAMGGTVAQVALCEGEISGVLNIWREKVRSTPAALSVTIATGALPQLPWSYFSSPPGSTYNLAIGYGGTATASCSTLWGTTATAEMERSTFEVRGVMSAWVDGSTGAYDALPSQIIEQLLTNTYWGLGWSTSLLGDYYSSVPFNLGVDGTEASGYAMYCKAKNFFPSLAVEEQRPTADIINEILTATDSVAVWSDGALKIRPLGEASATSGSYTYTPVLTPVYDLGAREPGADFLADPGEPAVVLERAAPADVFNCHPVEFSNRSPTRQDTAGNTITEPANAYNPDTEEVPDPEDADARGLRTADPVSLPCITRAAHAREISRLLTQRALYTERNRYKFRLGWRYALLEPTDLVTLTDAGLGLSRQLVRITSIEEDESGAFSVEAEEVGTIATAAAATYTVT